MKAILTSLLIIISMMSCKGNEKNQKNTDNQQKTIKRYNLSEGKITYKTTISGKIMGGNIQGNGTETRYFKNWGAVELVETKNTQTTTISILGNKQVTTDNHHSINKLDNGESYTVDFESKKIYANRSPVMDLIKTLEPNASAEKIGKKMLESIGGKEIGKEKINGVLCDVWEIPGGKQWMYKGVVLKSVITLIGVTTTTEVVTMDFNKNPSDKDLELPDFPIVKQQGFLTNIEFDEEMKGDVDDMKKELAKMKNMSFKEWKYQATKNDPEMREMSDEELRKIYDMIQKMMPK
ncbi:hypothetical protein [Tenacibaculum piscium]|uniref:hypothetical protein n=1 Tax=Tenacibaculum piscium TaxID=1458515 RepID=UPI001F40CA8A|nr:hypothetical protein [Tenacibaculum piscium]